MNMQWFDGFTRVNGELCLIDVNSKGVRTETVLANLAKSEFKHRTKRIKVESDFNDWQVVQAAEYLEVFESNIMQEERHQVFKFTYEGQEYLMPALVITKALFKPFHALVDYLYKPQGLEQVCFPMNDYSDIQFYSGIKYSRLKSQDSIKQQMSWLWAYPSANNAWHSVYSYACNDKIGLVLPKGNVKMVLHCLKGKRYLHIVDATIICIDTNEKPLNEAGLSMNTIVYHQIHKVGYKKNYGHRGRLLLTNSKLLKSKQGWTLTDEEWNEIETLLPQRTQRYTQNQKYSRREVLDAILIKLGSGVSWKKLIGISLPINILTWTYRQWKNEGLDQILDRLHELRSDNVNFET